MSNIEKRIKVVQAISESAVDLINSSDTSLGGALLKLVVIEAMRIELDALKMEHELEKELKGGGKDAEKTDGNS